MRSSLASVGPLYVRNEYVPDLVVEIYYVLVVNQKEIIQLRAIRTLVVRVNDRSVILRPYAPLDDGLDLRL